MPTPPRRRVRAHLQLLPTRASSVRPTCTTTRTLARLLRGRDAVINLVAILHGSEAEFERVPRRACRSAWRGLPAAGVQRLVHVSALGVGADAPSRYLRSKARGEAVLRGGRRSTSRCCAPR